MFSEQTQACWQAREGILHEKTSGIYFLRFLLHHVRHASSQVVMDSAERKVTAFLQQVNTIHNRKVLQASAVMYVSS